MATPRRRSARLSRKSPPERRKTPIHPASLGSLVERDDTPEGGPLPTLDAVLYTPTGPPNISSKARLDELSTITTPKALPRVERAEMNPKEMHQTTAHTPDSAAASGFTDIAAIQSSNTPATAQNTPSKAAPRPSLPPHLTAARFNFDFGHESQLSEAARSMMNNVREDAEQIKQQVIAGRDVQDRKDREAERLFSGPNSTRRKIAKARGKAGRFSDVHMMQFKKMDSIANHPSSFRAGPGFAQPTQQSLKRSGSKAGLDEDERPHSAKKSTSGRALPAPGHVHPLTGSVEQFPNSQKTSDASEGHSPAKRRKSTFASSSITHATNREDDAASIARPSTLPRPTNGIAAPLLTPTKASLARSNTAKLPPSSPGKASMLPRSKSLKHLTTDPRPLSSSSDSNTPIAHPAQQSEIVRSEVTSSVRPLPPLPAQASDLALASPTKPISATPAMSWSPSKFGLASKLPTFQGLKSILRPSRRASIKGGVSPTRKTSACSTPKRGNTAAPSESGSTKKVDFTPSTKSRYAVKLAVSSPSPTKGDPSKRATSPGLIVPYDPAAYLVEVDSDDEWEDAESEVNYPVLPTGDDESMASPPPVATSVATQSFARKAQEHSRRESKEFKSIFTTLEYPSRDSNKSTTLTDVDTRVNVREAGGVGPRQPNIVTRSPGGNNSVISKQSPSTTIRPVRSSTSGATSKLVQPFDDRVKTLPHGLPGKKRRRESDDEDDNSGATVEAKATKYRRKSIMPRVPGAWGDSTEGKENKAPQHQQQHGDVEDEGKQRGAKCRRIEPKTAKPASQDHDVTANPKPQVKKLNKAREAAARNVKQRKDRIPKSGGAAGVKATQSDASGGGGGGGGRGVLSLARLNMLSRPKERK